MKSKRIPLDKELRNGQFVLTVTILLTCSAGFFVNNWLLGTESRNAIIQSTASVLIRNLTTPLMFQDHKEVATTIASIENHSVIEGGIVMDTSGQILERYPRNIQASEFSPKDRQLYSFPISQNGEKFGSLILLPKKRFKFELIFGYGAIGLLVLVIGFLVSHAITRLTTRKITRQVSKLLQVIRGIRTLEDSRDHVDKLAPFGEITEIAELTEEFILMLELIRIRNQEIRTINERLEQTVEERTLSLKEAQATLVQSSRLSALGEMTAGLAHEVNNPLAIIMGKVRAVRKYLESNPSSDPEAIKHLDKIDATVRRIGKIIQGLRNFSRDGTLDPFESVRLKLILDDAIELCGDRFKHNSVELKVDSFDLELTLDCRAAQFGQVLLNLLNNAHDAITKFDVKWIHIKVFDDGTFIRILISDCGLGIPEATRKKVMQPFFTTKEVGKGTGLGLSISKKIIETHGGTLEIDEAAANTQFVIRLPKEQSHSPRGI